MRPIPAFVRHIWIGNNGEVLLDGSLSKTPSL